VYGTSNKGKPKLSPNRVAHERVIAIGEQSL
jgi:hypothetical protein